MFCYWFLFSACCISALAATRKRLCPRRSSTSHTHLDISKRRFWGLEPKTTLFSSKKFPVADRRPILFCICIWADRFEATCVMDEIFRCFNELMGMGSKYFLPLKNGTALDLAAITLKLAPSELKAKELCACIQGKTPISMEYPLSLVFIGASFDDSPHLSRTGCGSFCGSGVCFFVCWADPPKCFGGVSAMPGKRTMVHHIV